MVGASFCCSIYCYNLSGFSFNLFRHFIVKIMEFLVSQTSWTFFPFPVCVAQINEDQYIYICIHETARYIQRSQTRELVSFYIGLNKTFYRNFYCLERKEKTKNSNNKSDRIRLMVIWCNTKDDHQKKIQPKRIRNIKIKINREREREQEK